MKNIAYILASLLIVPSLLGLTGCSTGSMLASGVKSEARGPSPSQQQPGSSAPSQGDDNSQAGGNKNEFPSASSPQQITGSYLLDCAAASSDSYGCAIYDAATHKLITSAITTPSIKVTYADGTSEKMTLTSGPKGSNFKWYFQIDRRKVASVTGVSATTTINGRGSVTLPLKNVAAVSGARTTTAAAPAPAPAPAPASNTPVGTNLLQNGGFESGDLGNWAIWESTPGVTISEDKGPHSGTRNAAQIAASSGQSQSYLYQSLAVSNGNYTVSCWVAGVANNSLAFQAADWDSSSKSNKSVNVTSDTLSLYSLDVTVTSGWLTVAIWFDSSNAGDWSHIDDCSATRQ